MEAAQQQEIIEGQLERARTERWGRARDLKGWERMLKLAETSSLRAGKRIPEAAASGKQAIRKEIAQCLFDLERLDITIEDAESDLKAIGSAPPGEA